MTFLTNIVFNKNIKRKENLEDKHFDNILRYFDVL